MKLSEAAIMTESKIGGVKKWLVAIAIAIVFNLFVNYGIDTFYPGSERSDFCMEEDRFTYSNPGECEKINVTEELRRSCKEESGRLDYRNYDSYGCPQEAYCETCYNEFEAAEKSHSRNVFVSSWSFQLQFLLPE